MNLELASERYCRVVLILSVFLLLNNGIYAQTPDSLLHKLESTATAFRVFSSDTLKTVDSLRVVVRLDSVSTKLNGSIDSLRNLKLPTEQYYRRVDSLLTSTQTNILGRFSTTQDSLGSRTDSLVFKYKLKLNAKQQRLDSLLKAHKIKTSEMDDGEIPSSDDFKMPAVGSAEFNRPEIPGLNLPTITTDFPSVPGKLLDADIIPEELSEVKATASQAAELTDKAKKYLDKAADLKKVDVKEEAKKEAKKLPETVEKEIKNLDQVKEITNELPSKNMAQEHIEDMKSAVPDATNVEGEVRKRTQLQMKDYFAGKDETVKAGITKLEKLQKHYNTVHDMRKLPDRKPNNMKGKPFIERFVPGMLVQVTAMESAWKRIDFSPNANYWFHHKFRAGLGGSYRLSLNTSKFNITGRERVYGFRIYGNYKIHKGFFAHLEGESLRFNKPADFPSSESVRQWNYSMNTGLFKTYKINKFTKGTTVVLYDLLSLDETFNVNRIAVRFGLEFTFKKKKEKIRPLETNRSSES